jgi:syntaxin 1B/2/3
MVEEDMAEIRKDMVGKVAMVVTREEDMEPKIATAVEINTVSYHNPTLNGKANTFLADDVEMQNNPQSQYGGNQVNAGDRILDDCQNINEAINDLEARHNSYKALTSRILSDRAQMGELESATADIMTSYRNLADRMRKIKSNPESGSPRNAPQVGRVDRRLKASMQEFQKIESGFRAGMKEQQARQYRIVNPEATEEVFQQALMNADRRGQSQSTLNAVRQRHAAIQNIEQTMIELGQLFQDLDNLVLQQDVQVKQIEEKGEDVQENLIKGNEELDTGIKYARAARKKKWICLGIAVLIVLIIIIIVVVYLLVIRQQTKTVTGH